MICLLFQIFMTRRKIFEKKMTADKDGIRFATPEPVAGYRASRLKCRTIADISCGIGGQTIYFAKMCEHVYAVEIDPKKIEYAKENCRKHGLTNVTFICGDALSPEVIEQIPPVDIVFSDPARPPEEDERRTDCLRPGIPDVMKAYAHLTENFAFEAPPQMPPERIDMDCEKEYISLNGQLNRLTLYFGKIKQFERIAVSLPEGNAIVNAPADAYIPPMIESDRPGVYAFEPDPAVTASGLLRELVDDMIKACLGPVKIFRPDDKRLLLTSDFLTVHPLVKNNYLVLRTMPLSTEDDTAAINEYLKKIDAGSVVLRGRIDPKEYWNIRNALEDGISGKKKIHLYLTEKDGKKEAVLCEIVFE
ncbi:MAG: class I SAM-dependent methyltransferase [Methanosarcinaceae archaeon]|nr:class I SAM-dependent methyltransferase [Methanosarcinaceae archaeon]